MVMGLPENKCFRLIKNVGVNRAPVRIRLSGRVGDSGRDTFENEKFNKTNKCFEKIIENVGVNRAPVRIRLSGRVGDSGRDTFENKNLIRQNKCFD